MTIYPLPYCRFYRPPKGSTSKVPKCDDTEVSDYGALTTANCFQDPYSEVNWIRWTCDAKKMTVIKNYYLDAACTSLNPYEEPLAVPVPPFGGCYSASLLFGFETNALVKPTCNM